MRKSKAWWVGVVLGGVAIACVPILLVDYTLNAYVERNARNKLELVAHSALGLAEIRLEGAMAALVDLSAVVEGCDQRSMEIMRRTATVSIPIKEIAVLDDSGDTLCTNFGDGGEPRAISRELPLADTRFELALVRFRDRNDRALRLRLDRRNTKPLGALIPADFLVPDTVGGDFQDGRSLRLALDSEIVAARPVGDEGLSVDHMRTLGVVLKSERFPISVVVERPRATLGEEYRDVLTLGRLCSALITILSFAIGALYFRRNRNDPLVQFREAIKNGEIVPFFQPTIDIKTGKLVGAEVLARWRRPDGTMVSPANFIPLAERSGLIYPMTQALMRRTVLEVGDAHVDRPHLNVAFNLYAGHFANDSIIQEIQSIFGSSKIRLNQIVLEVTEREPLPNLDLARDIIGRLQKLGIRVAIDDVGTGHGGLSYLMKLGVDAIKIDKLFIDAINTERYSQTIIETLLELARTMKMEVIAEGVESFDQVEYLQRKGVNQAQGYVFAPALPASSYIALIEATDTSAPSAEPKAAAAA
ncbi:MAG: EAL domain-containing protein [Xanthobacteraceae bacterium]|nr:EAL domain-containing protein [Xanthobacteraceae bacterium]MBX3535825.1 EAL domain-containing protein [Xanthobacteraceae bacterium]MBX3548756.1 EAL domain-containing protein [Xanthobacteraceae bacterium]MCW5678706.1 EAL domain-containing protein [Xanthobacteraceae bacterium]